MDYGCIGEKLAHSFSAEIHPKLFDYKYELCEIPRDGIDKFMTERNFKAINVTIPYKQTVIPYLDEISKTAQSIGAVNTVVNIDGKLYGYNTDFSGMSLMIAQNKMEFTGKKVLILGSGGTSKTAFAVAQKLGAAEIYRVSRTANEGLIDYKTAIDLHSDAEIIINTTPCGMYPKSNEMPIDILKFKNLCGVVDAIYNPLRSKFVTTALSQGINATGGLYMLVAQAAFAAEKFVGKTVPTEKIDSIFHNMVSEKQNVVLVGMPSSGKSTVGKILARELNREYIDTDEEIERKENCTISEIFAKVGEEGFRKIESEVIEELSNRQGIVLATGGGAVLDYNNVLALRRNGRIYFLDRPLSELEATADRPLSSTKSALDELYEKRYPIYCKSCDAKIYGETPEVAVQKIKEDFMK